MNFVHDILLPIMIIVFGFAILGITLFFYKKGEIFFGTVLPIPVKIKKNKNSTEFWILLVSCIIFSLIVMLTGITMLFGLWG